AAPSSRTMACSCCCWWRPWWSSGASHVNQALPKKLWDNLGLVSIRDTINGLAA
ncbi:group II intron reverse transcriptase/maturase, partial [Pseudomonas protegens]